MSWTQVQEETPVTEAKVVEIGELLTKEINKPKVRFRIYHKGKSKRGKKKRKNRTNSRNWFRFILRRDAG